MFLKINITAIKGFLSFSVKQKHCYSCPKRAKWLNIEVGRGCWFEMHRWKGLWSEAFVIRKIWLFTYLHNWYQRGMSPEVTLMLLTQQTTVWISSLPVSGILYSRSVVYQRRRCIKKELNLFFEISQSELIKPASPQAAQLGIFLRVNFFHIISSRYTSFWGTQWFYHEGIVRTYSN